MEKAFRKSYGFAFAVWISPWLLTALSICLNKDLAKALFLNQIGLLITVAVFVWETIGCFLLTRGLPPPQPLTPIRGFFVMPSPKVLLVILIFVLPAFLLPMLVQVLITLLGVFSQGS